MQFDNQIASQTKSFKTDQAVGPGLDQAKVTDYPVVRKPTTDSTYFAAD